MQHMDATNIFFNRLITTFNVNLIRWSLPILPWICKQCFGACFCMFVFCPHSFVPLGLFLHFSASGRMQKTCLCLLLVWILDLIWMDNMDFLLKKKLQMNSLIFFFFRASRCETHRNLFFLLANLILLIGAKRSLWLVLISMMMQSSLSLHNVVLTNKELSSILQTAVAEFEWRRCPWRRSCPWL